MTVALLIVLFGVSFLYCDFNVICVRIYCCLRCF